MQPGGAIREGRLLGYGGHEESCLHCLTMELFSGNRGLAGLDQALVLIKTQQHLTQQGTKTYQQRILTYCESGRITISVTRSGIFLDFGQLFKAFGNN